MRLTEGDVVECNLVVEVNFWAIKESRRSDSIYHLCSPSTPQYRCLTAQSARPSLNL